MQFKQCNCNTIRFKYNSAFFNKYDQQYIIGRKKWVTACFICFHINQLLRDYCVKGNIFAICSAVFVWIGHKKM